jgi:hypothetical protein
MLYVQITDKEYKIPTKWEEVTLAQYRELVLNANGMNHIRLLSIFTGLSYDVLCNLPCDDFLLKAVPDMEFLSQEFNPFHCARKKRITIGKYEIETIRDPSKERFGQKLYMQQLVTSAIAGKANHITLVAPTIACYYAPLLHKEKKWDESHVKEVENVVDNMLVVEAFPEADFFLHGYMRYAPKKQMS